MLIKSIKTATVLLSLVVSTSAFSATKPYLDNQGLTPDEFSSSLFAGQWVVDDYKKATTGLKREPKFTTIEQADYKSMEVQIKKYMDSGDRTERLNALDNKKKVKSTLGTANFIDYVNAHFTEETAKLPLSSETLQTISDRHKEFMKDNDENTLLFTHYGKNNILVSKDIMTLINYRNIRSLSPLYDNWKEQIAEIDKKRNIDFSKMADFFLIDKSSSLYAIDYVSEDEFIVYSVRRDMSVNFRRATAEEDFTPQTTSSLFKQIEKNL